MRNRFKILFVILLIINILLVLHTNSYAIFFRGNATVFNNVYAVPYGSRLAIEEGEKVTTDNSSIAELSDKMITIKGTGYFKLSSTIESKKEEINAFAWNTYLEKGKYYVYKDKELTQIAGIMTSPTYLATELDSSLGILKIIDAYPSNQITDIKNTYIKSYYDNSTKLSTSVYFDYSFEMEDVVEAPNDNSAVGPANNENATTNTTPENNTGGTKTQLASNSKPIYKYKKSGKLKKSYKDSYISVRVEQISKYYVAKIWVKDPAKQVKKKEAGWGKSLKTVPSMLNGTKNAIIGCNGSGFYLQGAWSPSSTYDKGIIKAGKWNKTTEGNLVISNGVVRRKIKGYKCNTILGILPNGSFKYYETNPYTDVINDKVRDTFAFGPCIIKNGKSYTQSSKKVRLRKTYTQSRRATCVGQVDSNNYLIICANGQNTTLKEVRSVALKLDCKIMFNMDGGGSSTMWFRNKKSGKGTALIGGSRSVADALYFVSK